MGGIGIRDSTEASKHAFNTSVKATQMLSDAIILHGKIEIDTYEESLRSITTEMKKTKDMIDKSQNENLPPNKGRKMRRIIDNKCSTWLSIIPTLDNHFALSPDEFRDALAIQYNFTPKRIPDMCDGCGEQFNLTHALNCKKGGLVTAVVHRQNKR